MAMECEICRASPARDANVTLIRVNPTGQKGRWVCRRCNPPEPPDLTSILDILEEGRSTTGSK